METSRDDFVIAIRSAFLNKGTKQRFSLLVLILFSIIFMFLGSLNIKSVNFLKTLLKDVAYRSSFIVSGPENFIKNNYLTINSHIRLYKDHKKDKEELKSLKLKNLSNQILTLENVKYKKLIDDYFIKDNETYAKVLIDKQSPYLRSVIINKGSKHNVKLGMIVLDEDYLVGKIIEVNYLASRVLLISDINSKIPVSLQPGDMQAIMSGMTEQQGVLQYTKDKTLINEDLELLILTSGAGGVFKSGIPIGKIKREENTKGKNEKIVEFYKDFSQLKYVRVVSFLKGEEFLDKTSKQAFEKKGEYEKVKKENETLEILLEEKKIAGEIRIKIEEENNFLKNQNNKLQIELLKAKNEVDKNEENKEEFEFLKLNLIYASKCKKTIFNKLYKVGTKEYKNCILNRGQNKND